MNLKCKFLDLEVKFFFLAEKKNLVARKQNVASLESLHLVMFALKEETALNSVPRVMKASSEGASFVVKRIAS